jgi:exopolysaccharide production protein ExoY
MLKSDDLHVRKLDGSPTAQSNVSKTNVSKSVFLTLYRKIGKRALDLFFVVVSLPVTLPLILILAVLVLRDKKGPFFGHRRIGRNGHEFYCWKIRSMVPNAEERLRFYLESHPEARAEWKANFKLENDPRITRLGKFLRQSSLDELPQLWNILTGDMSVVGPRPVTATELDRYGSHVSEYHMMRPGLTGLWQVSGRNNISYEERVLMDVHYIYNCNLALDASIIMRTVMVVVGRAGK